MKQETKLEHESSYFKTFAKEWRDRPTSILALTLLAAFMGVLEFNIVQVALPTIRSQMGLPYARSE